MKVVAEYTSAPEDVKIMRREADGVADVRMTQNYTPGSGKGEDATPGTAEEVYFITALEEAPTAEEIRADWAEWWAYGEAWRETPYAPTLEERIEALEAGMLDMVLGGMLQ